MKTLNITDKEQERIVSSLHAMAAIVEDLAESDDLELLALKISEAPEVQYKKLSL